MNINFLLRKVLPNRVFRKWRILRISLYRIMSRYSKFRRENPDEHEQFRIGRVGQWD